MKIAISYIVVGSIAVLDGFISVLFAKSGSAFIQGSLQVASFSMFIILGYVKIKRLLRKPES
jgi:hypothetical protein